jgi:hypothetical protein
MAESRSNYLSRLQEYRQYKRLENLADSARRGLEHHAPDVLEMMAATARNIAQRLDELAGDARQRAQGEASEAETSYGAPADRPPTVSRETSTAGS